MNILLALLITVTAQAENNFDLWGKDNLAWENKTLASDISDYLLYSMLGASVIYTYDQKGAKHALAASGALAVNAGLNQLVKHQVGRERPDGSDNLSFYSGHSASAFAAGGIICLQSKKLCAPVLALASATAYLRVGANRHYLSDIIFGAGIGYVNGRYLPTLVISW